MEYAVIVAGGKGLRMGADLPKQFLPVGGKPVLMRTLEAFYAYSPAVRIILVLPHDQQAYGCGGNPPLGGRLYEPDGEPGCL